MLKNPVNINKAREILSNPNVTASELRDLAESSLTELQIWRSTFNDFSASVPMQTIKPTKLIEANENKDTSQPSLFSNRTVPLGVQVPANEYPSRTYKVIVPISDAGKPDIPATLYAAADVIIRLDTADIIKNRRDVDVKYVYEEAANANPISIAGWEKEQAARMRPRPMRKNRH